MRRTWLNVDYLFPILALLAAALLACDTRGVSSRATTGAPDLAIAATQLASN